MPMIDKINHYLKTPFRLGKNDCLIMAVDFLDDPIKDDIKGRYKTLLGAYRVLSKLTGYQTIQDYMTAHHTPVHALCLQDGDVIVDPENHCLIYFGGKVLFVEGDQFVMKPFDVINNNLPAFRNGGSDV